MYPSQYPLLVDIHIFILDKVLIIVSILVASIDPYAIKKRMGEKLYRCRHQEEDGPPIVRRNGKNDDDMEEEDGEIPECDWYGEDKAVGDPLWYPKN